MRNYSIISIYSVFLGKQLGTVISLIKVNLIIFILKYVQKTIYAVTLSFENYYLHIMVKMWFKEKKEKIDCQISVLCTHKCFTKIWAG